MNENYTFKSLEIINKVFNVYPSHQIGAFWSGGKDSTTMLSLIRLYNLGTLPIKIVGIDEGLLPEHYKFINDLKEAWNMDFEWYQDKHFMADYIKTSNKSNLVAEFKTDAIGKVIDKYNWDAVFVGIRHDEHEARSKEKYFSPRKNHVRVHPILHWTESDIWGYLLDNNIPYSILYKMGFRSLGNADLTIPVGKSQPERSGRDPSKENLMYVLRQFGYF